MGFFLLENLKRHSKWLCVSTLPPSFFPIAISLFAGMAVWFPSFWLHLLFFGPPPPPPLLLLLAGWVGTGGMRRRVVERVGRRRRRRPEQPTQPSQASDRQSYHQLMGNDDGGPTVLYGILTVLCAVLTTLLDIRHGQSAYITPYHAT